MAAKATGLNRSTILRAIKSGQVTGTKDQFGEWRVEPIELRHLGGDHQCAGPTRRERTRCSASNSICSSESPARPLRYQSLPAEATYTDERGAKQASIQRMRLRTLPVAV
jgi:hypothetical protein